eukprot:bmy_21973T0
MARQAFRKFLPVFDPVLVERSAAETVTKGGIMLPEKSQGKVLQATVVAVRSGSKGKGGEVQPVSVKVGDKVLLPEYGGTKRPTARAPEAPGTRGPPPPRAGARCQGARAELREAQPKTGRPRPSLPPPLVAHAGNPSPRLLRLRRSVVAMDSPWNELTLAFSRTSMFPFFDIAHYLVSVMALKHQPGECGAPRTGPLGMPLTARTA